MLISELPLGGLLKLGKHEFFDNLLWIKVSNQNDFCLYNALRAMCFDESEPHANSREHRSGGSNFYPHSIVHQWLNTRLQEGWYSPSHPADQSTYYHNVPGFLSMFSDTEYDLLKPRKFVVKTPQGSIRKNGETVEMEALVALPSVSELSGTPHCAEGEQFEYFRQPRHGWFTTATRTGIGPGCIKAMQVGNFTIKSSPPNRLLEMHPVIRVKNVEVESDNVAGIGCYSLAFPNPFSANETEFLSLIRAR